MNKHGTVFSDELYLSNPNETITSKRSQQFPNAYFRKITVPFLTEISRILIK